MSYDSERIGYAPTLLPEASEDLTRVLQEELWKLQNVLEYIQKGYRDILHVEPEKRREFMVVAADGTDWNPGHGAGLYQYLGGVWELIVSYGDVYGSIAIPAGRLTVPAVTNPGFAKFTDDGAGSNGVYTYMFDDARLEEAFFSVILPHDYKPGTDVIMHVHWSPMTNSLGNVYWGSEYVMQNVDGTFGNTTITTGVVAGDGTPLKHQELYTLTISGTGLVNGSVLLMRIFRDGAHASDTFVGDAAFLAIHIHYKRTKLE